MIKTVRTAPLFALFLFAAAGASAAEKVEVRFPEPGAVLTIRDSVGERAETVRWTVTGPEDVDGRAAYRLVSGDDYMLFDAETKSWMATRSHGRVKQVSPHNGQLSSPLWVGKEWTSSYLYTRRDGSEAEQRRAWHVEAREEVTVPAGTFDAFRIVSPGKVLTITLWYAPEVAFYVRRTTRGMVDVEQLLVGYEPASP